MIPFLRYLFPGGAPNFKWRGSVIEWGKTQNPKISQGFQQNPQKVSGPKTNPKKSHAEFLGLKNSQKAEQVCLYSVFADSLRCHDTLGSITNLQIVLNTRKNPYYKSSHPKNYLPNFPTPKNPGIETFKPTKSSDHPSEVHPTLPPPSPSICLFKAFNFFHLKSPPFIPSWQKLSLKQSKALFYLKSKKKIPQFRNTINGLENNTRLIPLNLLICRKSLFFYCVEDEKEKKINDRKRQQISFCAYNYLVVVLFIHLLIYWGGTRERFYYGIPYILLKTYPIT